MAERTEIEWCDATLNLWWGCTKVSDGCKHCYAETLTNRFGGDNWGPKGTRREVKSWRSTLEKISKRAKAEGRRLRVFVQSMSDTFEGPETMGGTGSENWETVERLTQDFFAQAQLHPHLDFLVLTKRPENVTARLGRIADAGTLLRNNPHVWIGTSVEDQKTADERIPHLLRIPAAVRFLSCEPLLGPVDLTRIEVVGPSWAKASHCNALTVDDRGWASRPAHHKHIDWIIAGGESGPNARPMHPDWARSLRDQCQAAYVPFFFKQWGEWCPAEAYDEWSYGHYLGADWDGNKWDIYPNPLHAESHRDDESEVYRLGKKRAGRVLDGREWSEFPKEDIRGS